MANAESPATLRDATSLRGYDEPKNRDHEILEIMFFALLSFSYKMASQIENEMSYLHRVAHEVVDSSVVVAGASVPGGGKNTTGHSLRVPGGTQSYYPAFWIRDAAMMLGADLIPAIEVEGWIRTVASVQSGPNGLDFPHGLHVPPYSIPDHITLEGEACWYPGAYTNQGVGDFGFLPPADDAYYFIQMVYEVFRLTRSAEFFKSTIRTAWGDHPLSDVAKEAFDSVAVDPLTGLVICDGAPGKTRVDWGFCDSIRKSGACLMPSLLRWQATNRLAEMFKAIGRNDEAKQYRSISNLIRDSIVSTFYKPIDDRQGMLLSATGVGMKDDVWASAFAVFLGALPKPIALAVSRHLNSLYLDGGTVIDGQVRQLPPTGEFGGHWEQAASGPDSYQNGGFWATPSGWLIEAINLTDQRNAQAIFDLFIDYLIDNRAKGAPFEWINPSTGKGTNGNYASSAGLVYVSLTQAGWRS